MLTPPVMTSNPHIRYMNSSGHGYNLLEIRPQALVCTMKLVDTIKQQQANLTTLNMFRVPANQVVIQECHHAAPCSVKRGYAHMIVHANITCLRE